MAYKPVITKLPSEDTRADNSELFGIYKKVKPPCPPGIDTRVDPLTPGEEKPPVDSVNTEILDLGLELSVSDLSEDDGEETHQVPLVLGSANTPQDGGEATEPGRISPVVPPKDSSPGKTLQIRVVKVKTPQATEKAPSPDTLEAPLQPRVVYPRGARKGTPLMRWVSTASEELITQTLGPNRDACELCEYRAPRRDKAVAHARQHFTRCFCSCQFFSSSRDSVYRHQRRHPQEGHGGSRQMVYEVDEQSYTNFASYMGWSQPPAFLPCQAVMNERSQRQRVRTAARPLSPLNRARSRSPVRINRVSHNPAPEEEAAQDELEEAEESPIEESPVQEEPVLEEPTARSSPSPSLL